MNWENTTSNSGSAYASRLNELANDGDNLSHESHNNQSYYNYQDYAHYAHNTYDNYYDNDWYYDDDNY